MLFSGYAKCQLLVVIDEVTMLYSRGFLYDTAVTLAYHVKKVECLHFLCIKPFSPLLE